MTSYNYLQVGLKLLGVYFLTTGLAYLSAIYSIYTSVATGELDSGGREITSNALSAVIVTVAGPKGQLGTTMSIFGMLNTHYLWQRGASHEDREAYALLVTDLILGGVRGL